MMIIRSSSPQFLDNRSTDATSKPHFRSTVELGRTKIPIRHILQLAQGSVVELEGLAGEPMDVLVNGCLIAQGEVVVVNDKFGIRLTDIITPSERIRKLTRGSRPRRARFSPRRSTPRRLAPRRPYHNRR